MVAHMSGEHADLLALARFCNARMDEPYEFNLNYPLRLTYDGGHYWELSGTAVNGGHVRYMWVTVRLEGQPERYREDLERCHGIEWTSDPVVALERLLALERKRAGEGLEGIRAKQARARELGLDYSAIRDIIRSANNDETSMGRAVELLRDLTLSAVDKAVVEDRSLTLRWLWRQSLLTHDYEGTGSPVGDVYASAARAIERGDHLPKEEP